MGCASVFRDVEWPDNDINGPEGLNLMMDAAQAILIGDPTFFMTSGLEIPYSPFPLRRVSPLPFLPFSTSVTLSGKIPVEDRL